METMIKSGVTYTYNKNEIVNIINNTIDFIEIWVEKNKFRIKINKNIPKSNQPVLYVYPIIFYFTFTLVLCFI